MILISAGSLSIPLLTNLSTTKVDSQSIGVFHWGEILADVNLGRIYNAYADPGNNTIFLLSVLQKDPVDRSILS